jgi:hypothetical protein
VDFSQQYLEPAKQIAEWAEAGQANIAEARQIHPLVSEFVYASIPAGPAVL